MAQNRCKATEHPHCMQHVLLRAFNISCARRLSGGTWSLLYLPVSSPDASGDHVVRPRP